MFLIRSLIAMLMVLTAFTSQAHSYKVGAIDIGHPWARPTAAGQKAGGGYLKLTNAGAADRLVSVSSDVSDSVELHTMSMDGTVMRMRQVDGIDLPAGQTVELKPGGLHIMFIGLKAPLQEGSKFPVKLKFEKAGEVVVDVKVQQPKGAAAEHKH
ncbi:MAG: copper chaperone PCu(A)C [Burkholderiaceae bacterium]